MSKCAEATAVIDLIYQGFQLLKNAKRGSIMDISIDGDHKSSEVIISLGRGKNYTTWVISSSKIKQLEEDSEV